MKVSAVPDIKYKIRIDPSIVLSHILVRLWYPIFFELLIISKSTNFIFFKHEGHKYLQCYIYIDYTRDPWMGNDIPMWKINNRTDRPQIRPQNRLLWNVFSQRCIIAATGGYRIGKYDSCWLRVPTRPLSDSKAEGSSWVTHGEKAHDQWRSCAIAHYL